MAANYPTSLPSTSPATHQNVLDEVVAIATELGTDPAGSAATVRARLEAAESRGFPPSYHGLQCWNYDPELAQNQAVWPNVAGGMRTIRVWTPVAINVTAVWMAVQAVGVTLTANQNRGALYDATGTLIANSLLDDQATAWVSTGAKRMLVNGGTPVAVAAGAFDVGIWVTGTTAPTFYRAGTGTGVSALNLAAATARYTGTNQTGTTTAPATTGTRTIVAEGWWVGIE